MRMACSSRVGDVPSRLENCRLKWVSEFLHRQLLVVALLEDADHGGQLVQLGVLLGRVAHREIWLRGPGRAYLRPEETTVAQVLRQAGSATANFGKTHAIGIDKKLGPQRNRHFGFDQFLLDYEYAKNWLGPNFPLSVVSQDGITEFPVNAEIERTMTENYGP